MKNAAVAIAPAMTWGNWTNTCGLKTSAAKLSISARPLRRTWPIGCCMNEFATRIQNADTVDPTATHQIEARCSLLGNRSHPKIQIPRNVDSRKNASNASMARGAPNTSPTKREYSDQFMPNWNS
jgi:hypothetical protein